MFPLRSSAQRLTALFTGLLLTGAGLSAADLFEVVSTLRQNPTVGSADLVIHPSGDFYYQASSLGVVVMVKTAEGAWRMEQIAAHQDGVEPELSGHDLEIG